MKNTLYVRVISKELDENEAPYIKTHYIFFAKGVSFVQDDAYSWCRELLLDIDTPDGMERVKIRLDSEHEVLVETT